MALLYRGACLSMIGEYSSARDCWNQIIQNFGKLRGDMGKTILMRARTSIQRTFPEISALELLVLWGQVRITDKESASKVLPHITTLMSRLKPSMHEEEASIQLLLGALQSLMADYPTALSHLNRCIEVTAGTDYKREVLDKYHAPFAYFEIAVAHLRLGDLKDAKMALEKCEKIEADYSFEMFLSVRMKGLKQFLYRSK